MTETTTLAAVKFRQSIWAQWMEEAVTGLKDTDMVTAVTNCTPFGNYLIGLAPAGAQ